MKKIGVRLVKKIDSSYDILIETGLSKKLGSLIAKSNFGNRYCIITDSTVEILYAKKLLADLRKQGVKAELIAFPTGEKSKSMVMAEKICSKMLGLGFDRKTCIVAMGGGVSGDLAGFVASIYMRGIDFVQVPTTLLAMIDSSVGGKTGVNLAKSKNSIGCFHQPKKVFVCPEFLQTLPERELKSGLAEVIKHAVILDKKLFSFLEKNQSKIFGLDMGVLERVVAENCRIKASVVSKDEKEANFRRVLNYGHTIGHAIESAYGYGKFSHGGAVAMGMIVEAKISMLLGLMSENDFEKTKELIHNYGLGFLPMQKINAKKIVSLTKGDKKSTGGKVFYSLPKKIGEMYSAANGFGVIVKDSVALKALGEFK